MMISLMFCLVAWSGPQDVSITFEVPAIDAQPYHKPYVAVWVETLERKGLHSIAVWHEKDDWLKDLRQWWRKLGRGGASFDGVSGATRKPGIYTVNWNASDASGKQLPPGEYYLNIEAAREQGGRDFIRQKIQLGQGAQEYKVDGDLELGSIVIRVGGVSS